ncbi:MAG: hypothetical protein ACXU8S_00995 [Phenylobacterium sp.]
MKLSILLAATALAISAGAASADVIDKTTTTICLDSGGRQLAAHCKSQDASRLTHQEDICICPAATQQVKAPLCAPGVNPPGESAAYEQARLKAVTHGSLVSANWNGQPMCVAPHRQ